MLWRCSHLAGAGPGATETLRARAADRSIASLGWGRFPLSAGREAPGLPPPPSGLCRNGGCCGCRVLPPGWAVPLPPLGVRVEWAADGQAGGQKAVCRRGMQPPHLHRGGPPRLRCPRLSVHPHPERPSCLRLLQAEGPRTTLLGRQCARRLLWGAAGPPGFLPQLCGPGEPVPEARQGGGEN